MPGLPPDHRAFAEKALPLYGLGPSTTLRLLSLSENATYLAEDHARRLVVRVHRPGYHSVEAIRSELRWMAALGAETPVSTPAPVAAVDGAEVVEVTVDGRTLLVDAVTVVSGRTAEEASHMVDFATIGAITAHLHEHSSRWPAPADFVRFTWDVETMLGPEARWGQWRKAPGLSPEDCADIDRAVRVITDRLTEFGTGPDRFGLVHADLRLANLMVDPHADLPAITVIDFDDCGWSWHLADLGSAVSWVEHEPGTEDLIDAWLRGYTAVRPLPDDHLAMIPTFVLLRRIHLTAWVASHSDADAALGIADDFVSGTASLARRYLDDPSWLQRVTTRTSAA
ncbi:phosphotransferase enzyme family protein [Gordonia sp. C13]|uniref:phosphotransferase enzyme family protein n=1 Tax=Gordonia sp. C13 TaxID=2935078 RepID=UPI00200A8D1E|nr:phosphotransferase [Gordonia sp. C13]MCK8615189.1 phosphotransferase [Gordonia sp. C13]